MKIRELVCIVCPKGCKLLVEKQDNKIIVSGNSCKRGEKYGINEVQNPKRVLTSTIRVINSKQKRISVKTTDAIPKEMLFNAMKEISKIEVKIPMKVGDIIKENFLNTKTNLICTKTIKN
ncbi:molybdopterin oxidoreductase [Clostridiaceae bacterium 14S0207]|nr:molybdopterin oxidoreductase [Clostridiaceae bacterium 14S0207]